jgi:hypothetical protein
MAVTRQEEQLLAALRQKRARMRESIIAEFEEEQEKVLEESIPQSSADYRQRFQQPQQAPDVPLPKPPKQRSLQELKRPRSRQMSRRSSLNSVRLAPLQELPPSYTLDQADLQQEDQTVDPSRTPPKLPAISTEFGLNDPARGQILMYIDRPMEDHGEPSPDLSDFMVLDDGNSDDQLFQSHTSDLDSSPPSKKSIGSDQGSQHRGRTTSRAGDVEPVSPMMPSGQRQRRGTTNSKVSANGDDHVRIVGDSSAADDDDNDEDVAAGIPRPDSPISIDPALVFSDVALPIKKQARLSAVGLLSPNAVAIDAERWMNN